MKKVIVCSHVLQTPEMPCFEILGEPIHENDTGRNYLCPTCEAHADKLTADQLHVICAAHCEHDAMTIIETIDARSKQKV